MKTSITLKTIPKAITFLTVVISCLVSCTSCESEPYYINPKIVLLPAENVKANSAVLVADLTTKSKPLSVLFEYFEEGLWHQVGTTEEIYFSSEVYPANKTTTVKKEIKNLTRGKNYQFRATAFEVVHFGDSHAIIYLASSLETKEFTTLDPSILTIKEMKSNFTTISLKLELVPKVANTKVQIEYQVNGLTRSKQSYQIKIKTINEFAVELDTIFKTCAVSDFDGNTYRIVTIGNQVWLQENFRGTHFANGDEIPNVTGQSEWEAMKTPAYCWYNNDAKIGEVYGGLYNWYVASDPRGLIANYHTPSLDEWYTLANYLGGEEVAGAKMKEAGFAHWIQPDDGATNSSGFSGLPSGSRRDSFGHLGDATKFWSATGFGITNVVHTANLNKASVDIVLYGGEPCCYAYSIRLVKN